MWKYSCAGPHGARLVRGVSEGASTWCWHWLAPACQLKRMKRKRLPQESLEVGHTEMTRDWSLVVKGWNCMRGNVLQSGQGSDLKRGYKSDNIVLVI